MIMMMMQCNKIMAINIGQIILECFQFAYGVIKISTSLYRLYPKKYPKNIQKNQQNIEKI